jgi:hypothetical protein
MQHGAFDDIPDMVKEAVMTDIADHLLDQWINGLLDEGQYFADLNVASMSGDIAFQKRFNEFYNLTPEDNDYFEVE